MKGYTVDVRGFNADKKKLVVEAIDSLIGSWVDTYVSDRAMDVIEVFTSVDADGYTYRGTYGNVYSKMSDLQLGHKISFNDLMVEAGFNYEENGVEDFKWIDWSEREATESKPVSNKTRPLITREQYDAVMAQSDKRTFTKALDDLLAIEKEQLLDESAIRIKQLEKENRTLTEKVDAGFELWASMSDLNDVLVVELSKKSRALGVLSLLLISSVAALLAVISLQ